MGDILNPISTLAAAFMGSWAAFRLQLFDRKGEERKLNVAAGNRALIALLQQVNTLKLFQDDSIEPFRRSPIRAILMRPVMPYSEEKMGFDIKELNFLVTPENQQVLLDLILEERRFRECIQVINTRSRFHHEIIQPGLEKAGVREGRNYSGEQLVAAVGEVDYLKISRLTDDTVHQVDKTVESHIKTKNHLLMALTKSYPGEKFIDFDLAGASDPLKTINEGGILSSPKDQFSENVRFYSEMRFKQLTLLLAALAIVGVGITQNNVENIIGTWNGRSLLSLFSILFTAVMWVMEVRATQYWVENRKRVEENFPHPKVHRFLWWLDATNAVLLFYLAIFSFWIFSLSKWHPNGSLSIGLIFSELLLFLFSAVSYFPLWVHKYRQISRNSGAG